MNSKCIYMNDISALCGGNSKVIEYDCIVIDIKKLRDLILAVVVYARLTPRKLILRFSAPPHEVGKYIDEIRKFIPEDVIEIQFSSIK